MLTSPSELLTKGNYENSKTIVSRSHQRQPRVQCVRTSEGTKGRNGRHEVASSQRPTDHQGKGGGRRDCSDPSGRRHEWKMELRGLREDQWKRMEIRSRSERKIRQETLTALRDGCGFQRVLARDSELRRFWKAERNNCPAIDFALNRGRAAVKIDNRFHKRQTQSCAIGA